jgi:hypothetical protein
MISGKLSFHVFHIGGKDPVVREHLNSLRRHYPSSRIIYLTDSISELQDTDVIDSISRFDSGTSSIMYTRIAAYSAEPVSGPTFFLDTDILVNKTMPSTLLSALAGSIAVCKRQYNCDAPFNPAFRGIDFSRYSGMSLGSVFPYLACCTYSETTEVWQRCLRIMEDLDDCFYKWYGDQECLKILLRQLASNSTHYKELPESLFAALPTHASASNAYFIHYKGEHKATLRSMIESGFLIE